MVNHLKTIPLPSYRVVIVCDNVHLSNTVSSKEFNLLIINNHDGLSNSCNVDSKASFTDSH